MMKLEENLEIIWHGTASNFPLVRLGDDIDHHLYFFHQPRPGTDEFWAGLQTFRRPPEGTPVDFGYGYYPGRHWNQHFLQEAGGEVMSRSMIAERVYLTPPHYRDVSDPSGQFVRPNHFDADGVPRKADGERLGGIHFLGAALETYIERQPDGDIRFVSPQVPQGVTLSKIAQALQQLGIS